VKEGRGRERSKEGRGYKERGRRMLEVEGLGGKGVERGGI